MSNATQELSPEVVEQARKLLEQKAKKAEKAKENIRTKYPFADAETLQYDPVAKKNSVEVECVECGKVHRRYTSDLFQCKGVCPDCKKNVDKARRAAKKAQLARALQAIENGEIE